MKRHELTDPQWELVADFFPIFPPRRGGQWNDHRLMLNGILWRINTGAPWRDLLERCGPWKTVYERFRALRQSGRLDERGLIDVDLFCIDGTNIRATRAAAGAAKKQSPDRRAG